MKEQNPSPVQGECLTVTLRGDYSLPDTASVTLWPQNGQRDCQQKVTENCC